MDREDYFFDFIDALGKTAEEAQASQQAKRALAATRAREDEVRRSKHTRGFSGRDRDQFRYVETQPESEVDVAPSRVLLGVYAVPTALDLWCSQACAFNFDGGVHSRYKQDQDDFALLLVDLIHERGVRINWSEAKGILKADKRYLSIFKIQVYHAHPFLQTPSLTSLCHLLISTATSLN